MYNKDIKQNFLQFEKCNEKLLLAFALLLMRKRNSTYFNKY